MEYVLFIQSTVGTTWVTPIFSIVSNSAMNIHKYLFLSSFFEKHFCVLIRYAAYSAQTYWAICELFTLCARSPNSGPYLHGPEHSRSGPLEHRSQHGLLWPAILQAAKHPQLQLRQKGSMVSLVNALEIVCFKLQQSYKTFKDEMQDLTVTSPLSVIHSHQSGESHDHLQWAGKGQFFTSGSSVLSNKRCFQRLDTVLEWQKCILGPQSKCNLLQKP